MASFGEVLKRERELRDISLREISEATKISLRHLEALESNRFRDLPGGLFNKGFIRAYSGYIGIDSEEMVNNYLYEVDQQEEPDPIESLKALLPPEPGKPSPRWRQWLVPGGILIGGAVLFIVLNFTLRADRENGAPEPATVAKPLQEEGFADRPRDDLPPGEGEIPESPVMDPPRPGGGAHREAPTEVRLELKMTKPARVQVLCDGTEVLNNFLIAGESRSFRCGELNLSATDASALRYSLNRTPWVTAGNPGVPLKGLRITPGDVPNLPSRSSSPSGGGEGRSGRDPIPG